MLAKLFMILILFVAVPVWSQVEPAASGPPPEGQDTMQTPPPVNDETYPTDTRAEIQSNELRARLSVQTAYSDNVIGAGTTTPDADTSYSIGTTVSLDRMTNRFHQTLTYNSGFTAYQHTSARNEADQSASAGFHYRLSPHVSASFMDAFQKSTNIFNQPYAGVSASAPSFPAVEAPFADQISNGTKGELTYQFSSNGMIGGSGASTLLHYLDPAEASGLSNSNSIGATGFYNLRLSRAQYTGMSYQFSSMTASALNSQSVTRIDTIYFFYSVYLNHSFSLSLSGGPQYYNLAEAPFPSSSAWTPALTASMGWQGSHTSLAVSYSRSVTGAGGLIGAFESNSIQANARCQLARTWTIGLTGSYAVQRNVAPALFSSNLGGHSASGAISVQRSITERLKAEIGYTRLDQTYLGVAVISANPDSDREYISVSYQFRRPLGR